MQLPHNQKPPYSGGFIAVGGYNYFGKNYRGTQFVNLKFVLIVEKNINLPTSFFPTQTNTLNPSADSLILPDQGIFLLQNYITPFFKPNIKTGLIARWC